MKPLLLLFMSILSGLSFAQNVAINTTGNTADPSAILDVSANGKGILIPRMMPWERGNIQNPANGLLVYDLGSNSFWYYANGWQEIGGSGSMSGPAGGDLSGNYPTPNVAKLQNLDVAFGVPFDKQVLKWDALSNNWKGRNDSLFLPYVAATSDPMKVFSITNTFNGFSHSTAILGKRLSGSGIGLSFSTGVWGDAGAGTGVLGTSNTHAGVHGISLQNHGLHGKSESGNGFAGVFGTHGSSGIVPGNTMGVWGDNSNGIGVVGTSSTGVGVYGLSNINHGVYGYSTTADFAGVKGSHANDNGIGVMGEIGQAGLGVYGKGTGNASVAGRFENTSGDNTYMALDARNLGKGPAATFWTTQPDNTGATVLVTSHSSGHGLFALHDSVGNNNSAIRGWHVGLGEGIYAKSKWGDAGKMVIDNFLSEGNALSASTLGTGSAGVFQKVYVFGEATSEPAVLIDNYSRSVGLKVKSLYNSSTASAIDVEFGGYGFAVDIATTHSGIRSITNNMNGLAIFGKQDAIEGTAIMGTANAHQGIGVHGSANGSFGFGVLGSTTSHHGIAVKGESTSDLYGAITGVNTGNGGGVHGINEGEFGFGVIGESGPISGIGGVFRSNSGESEFSPAIWAHVQSRSNGIEVAVTNSDNAKNALQVVHQGTGNLASFEGFSGDEVTIANNANITTSGTVTVKNNKGIVRNSGSAQKRMETLDVDLIHFNMPVGAMVTQTVTFAQAFSAAPVVTLGNINSGFSGPCEKMTVQIKNVTASGCTVTMYNPGVTGNPDVSGTWNLLVIGNE